MREYGKYENQPDGAAVKQPKVKNVLLQTYFTSLLCMVLCVSMFLGTSYAWFSSEVVNTGNEIYIGVLDVELEKKNGEDWESLSTTKSDDTATYTNHLYSGTIWEPGYTSVETVRVVDQGDLAFDYALTFTDGQLTGDTTAELQAVAQWFDVWVYDYQKNTTSHEEVAAYGDIIAEGSGWTNVGTLADVLTGTRVFAGAMDAEDVVDNKAVHTYSIALHMNGGTVTADQEEALNALMGQKLTLSVKLVATQRSSEKDGFGNADYDATMEVVDVTPENIGEIDFDQDNTRYRFLGAFGDVSIITEAGLNQVYDGSGATEMDVFKLGYKGGVAHSYADVRDAEREGSYTVENFEATSVCVAVYNTTIHVSNNTVEFINIDSVNVTLSIQGNVIDANDVGHLHYQDGNSDYGIYIYAIDYTLSCVGNTVSGTKSHAIGINGRIAENDFGNATDAKHANSITEFAENKITVTASGKSALKIWGDGKYTPEATVLSDAAKELIELVEKGENVITKKEDMYNFCFDQVKIAEYTVGSDLS